MIDHRALAIDVVKLAAGMDHRIAARSSEFGLMVDAWQWVFAGSVWPMEAHAAVVDHYRRPNAFPIMPGDVVDYCAKQPPWSSREHATDFVRSLRDFPHTPLIEHYSGMVPPPDEFESWIAAEEAAIVAMILALKKRAPVS